MVYIVKRYTHDYGFFAMVNFDPLSAIVTGLSVATSAAGTVMGYQGSQQEASAATASANYQATQYRQQAQQSRATAQRSALEKDRQTDLAQSSLVARAAAGGGSATDETVLNLGEGIAGRGEYEHLMDMYNGENTARGYEDAANAAIYQGQVKSQAAKTRGISTIVSGVGSLAGKYSGSSFKLPTSEDIFGTSSSFTNGQISGRKSVYG